MTDQDVAGAETEVLRMARKERRARRWDRVFVRVGLALIIVGLVLIRVESGERRDQTCLSFERQERTARAQLERQRNFLAKEDKNAYERGLAPLIRTNLPGVVEEVKANRAPVYCDEDGVGLPEEPAR